MEQKRESKQVYQKLARRRVLIAMLKKNPESQVLKTELEKLLLNPAIAGKFKK